MANKQRDVFRKRNSVKLSVDDFNSTNSSINNHLNYEKEENIVDLDEKKVVKEKRVKIPKSTKQDSKEVSSRLWQILIYPDDVKIKDFAEWFESLGIEGAISPLHCADFTQIRQHIIENDYKDNKGEKVERFSKIYDEVNQKFNFVPDPDGDYMWDKDHYHVLIHFQAGSRNRKYVYNHICKPLGSPMPITSTGVRTTIRYHIHLDSPWKFQYSAKDERFFGGYCPDLYMIYSELEKEQIKKEVTEYIFEEQITNFSELVKVAMVEHADTWYPIIERNSAWFERIIKGIYNIRYIKEKQEKDREETLYRASHIEELSKQNKIFSEILQILISSHPEIYDNDIKNQFSELFDGKWKE